MSLVFQWDRCAMTSRLRRHRHLGLADAYAADHGLEDLQGHVDGDGSPTCDRWPPRALPCVPRRHRMKLSDAQVLLTGGGRGLGRYMAAAASQRTVPVSALERDPPCESLLASAYQLGCDVTDRQPCPPLVSPVEEAGSMCSSTMRAHPQREPPGEHAEPGRPDCMT